MCNRALSVCFCAVLLLGVICKGDEGVGVLLGPERVTLHPTKRSGPGSGMPLYLSIVNSTGHTRRFSNFYESWSPILMSEDGGTIAMPLGGRDVTFPPTPGDYPWIRPGRRATAKRGCILEIVGDKFVFSIGEETGSEFSAAVTPGHYKLCVSYRARVGEGTLFWMAIERFNAKPQEIWPGWQMSNWIDVFFDAK